MNNPRSVVLTRESGRAVYAVEPPDYILDKVEMSRPTEFIHLTGVYFEGGEFPWHVRAVEVSQIIGVSDERFQFELQEFMFERETREMDRAMRNNTAIAQAAMAHQLGREGDHDNDEEDEQ